MRSGFRRVCISRNYAIKYPTRKASQVSDQFEISENDISLMIEVFELLGFQKERYLEENPDLMIFRDNLGGLIHHYVKYGHLERRKLTFKHPRDQVSIISERLKDKNVNGQIKLVLDAIDISQRSKCSPVSQASRLIEAIGDTPISVRLDHVGGPRIGDSLTAIPWMVELSSIFRKDIHVTGVFHSAIKPLVSTLPLRFDEPPIPGPILRFTASVLHAFGVAHSHSLHIAQGYFWLAEMAIPPIPFMLPLHMSPTMLKKGFCIHPFTTSDNGDHNKLWWPERWQLVIKHILERFPETPIYLLGTKNEDIGPYLIADSVIPILGYPLEEVLDLLVRCFFFISVDSGLSHLAHFGGVKNHLILYPAETRATVVANPRGHIIHKKLEDIMPEDVNELLDRILF